MQPSRERESNTNKLFTRIDPNHVNFRIEERTRAQSNHRLRAARNRDEGNKLCENIVVDIIIMIQANNVRVDATNAE